MENVERSDHSGLRGIPASSFIPLSIPALQQFLQEHPQKKFRIGGGLTGVSGAAVPEPDEAYIDLRHLKKIEWIDAQTGILQVEAGVTMEEIKRTAESENWFFPVVPGSAKKATIGGMIACNGGSAFSLRYGKIGHYILGVDYITPDGLHHQAGGIVNKNASGIELTKLFIGSEGTLAFLTSVFLRCIPPPPQLIYTRIAGNSFQSITELVPDLLKHNPYLLEIAEKEALSFSSKANEHVLWIATDTSLPSHLYPEFRFSVHDEIILQERFSISYSIQFYKPFIDLDISFPVHNSAKGILAVKKCIQQNAMEHICFGHAGDGNWHVHVFLNNDAHQLPLLYREIVASADY